MKYVDCTREKSIEIIQICQHFEIQIWVARRRLDHLVIHFLCSGWMKVNMSSNSPPLGHMT